jgi:hypothetical protein
MPAGFLVLGMLLATLSVGCAVVVTAPYGNPRVRALFGLISLLSLVLVEALWWVRPWVARAADAWAAACVGSVLLSGVAAGVFRGLGLLQFVLLMVPALLVVGLPCEVVRWYVRDRARKLGLAPGAAP